MEPSVNLNQYMMKQSRHTNVMAIIGRRLGLLSATLLASAFGFAQQSSTQAPSPERTARHSRMASMLPPQRNTAFKGEKPFSNPSIRVQPSRIKSVGDGTALYGCAVSGLQWTEDNSPYGIYKLTATKDFTTEAVKTDYGFKSNAGVYADGKFYSFYVEEFWGWVDYLAYSVYDTETWTVEKVLSPSLEWTNVPYSSAITYDETSGKIFAVTYTGNEGSYALSTFDTNEGTFTKVASLERAYITLAASPQGVLYGVSDDGNLYRISASDGSSTLIGNTRLSPQYAQSMTFDPNTGSLYWAFMNSSGSALYQLNTTTASPCKLGDIAQDMEIVGLYVCKEAIADQAPQGVSALTFTPSMPGSLTGAVSCVAPSTATNGEQITGSVTVTICSGDETLCQQSVQPGQTVSVADVTFEANTLYTLFATASNDAGQGPKQSITVFVGKDVASAPSNVILQVDANKLATLTWTAPTSGNNGGYIDTDATTYKIVRHASGSDDVTVTDIPVNATSFSETLPTTTAQYSYSVTAYSDGAEGGTATSNRVVAVGQYELPFYDNFQDGDMCKQLYTFLDLDNDGHDNQSLWFWKEDEKLMQFCTDGEHVGNDWLFTPAIHLDATHMYNLKFNVNMGATSNLRVTFGTSPDPTTQQTIIDLNGIWESWQTEHTASFKVDKDACYYIGFYNYSGTDSYYFNLFDIGIDEGIETNIPDSVTAFVVTPDAQGANQAVLAFRAPEKLVNGTAITGTMDINIYRNDVQVTTLTASAGQQLSYTDAAAENNNNTYKVVASYQGKEGVASSQTVWVGYDISEAVGNLSAMSTDGNMHALLSWEAPQKGVHSGYFNPTDVTYTVWRSSDSNNFSAIAQGLTTTTYTDLDIASQLVDHQEVIYYAVTADTKAGQSESGTSFLTLGKPYDFPASESFPTGQFEITPWTYKTLSGQLGWETRRSDSSSGVTPQDQDRGFIKFYNSWGDSYVDSRLITPVVSLENAVHPTFSFYMFHWLESTVPADNKLTRLVIEVAPEGGDFVALDTLTAAYGIYGWVEHRISLEKYKQYKYVKIGLRGVMENTWMYYYVDNIHFDEQLDNDLAISGFDGDTESEVNQTCNYYITYYNRGLKVATDYTVNLLQDDKVVATVAGESINPGEIKEVQIPVTINATMAGKTASFQASIVYEADENMGNNTSLYVDNEVTGTWYPKPTDLSAATNGSSVSLAWKAAELPQTDVPTTDGFEDYDAFAISGFGDWISYDGDRLGSGKINTLPDFANQNTNMAFQVWRPTALEGVTAETYPNLMPHSGDQCLIAWYANTSIDWATPVNNDYLISPEVKGGTEMSFYIKRINPSVSEETYEVMYSTTTASPDAFVVLTESEAPAGWEQVTVMLPNEAKYFAIHYTASLKDGILVDDITYTSALYALQLQGFNVFRNGEKLNDGLVAEPAWADNNVPDGRQRYQVSVVYNRGESEATDAVIAQVTTDLNTVDALQSDSYTIHTIDGQFIGKNLKRLPNLKEGVYIINHRKVVIK